MFQWLRAKTQRREARRLAAEGQWAAAIAVYARLRAADMDRPADGVREAGALEAAGAVEEAAERHQGNARRHPTAFNVHRQRGLFFLRQGDVPAARLAFAQARALAGPQTVLDRDLERLGVDPAEARVIALAAFAASLDPDVHRPSRWTRFRAKRLALAARRMRARGAWDAAARVQAKVLDHVPWNGPAHVRLGHALKESGRIGDAERAYWAGVALSPRDADPFLQLGHALKLNHGRQAALPAYLIAHHLAPGHPDVARDLGDFDLPVDVVESLSGALCTGDAETFLASAEARAAAEEPSSSRARVQVPRQRRPARPLPARLEVLVNATAGDLARSVGASV